MTLKRNLLQIIFLLIGLSGIAQYSNHFHNKTLRIDYIHAGNHDTGHYFIDELLDEPYWGGSKVNLIDTLRYGDYFFEVVDISSGEVIYSRGYSTLFHEWQTTDEARLTSKAFSETIVFPFPKNKVRVDFYSRNRSGKFIRKFNYDVDPQSYFIKPERRLGFPVFDVHVSGNPATSVDIVILPDGYTQKEMKSFVKDCKAFTGHLFSYEPFASNRDKFNIRCVKAPSEESGSDIPGEGVWRNTILSAGFYTFDLERYCMTHDNKSVRDLAANAPYDQIYILVNHKKYGGGAIYNHYSLSVNSNASAAKIFIHEFGHGFAALGDEYYTSDVAYNDFYPLDVEPWEPNITTLVDFESKWKRMLEHDIPIPTPSTNEFTGRLGVFEGGGYSAKGIYRPAYDCIMNTMKVNEFCSVCNRSIQQMIDFYTK
jgi:hypothetical protein